MKSKLLLACTILFFCSSFLCGQNQTSKVANSAETNNGAVRHPWQGKRVGYLGDSITDPNCYGDKIKKYWDFLQEWLGITPYVYGISGRQWNDVPCQAEKLKQEHGGEVDAILILMGTIDFNDGVPIGEWFTETEEQVMAARGLTKKLETRKKRTPIMDGNTYKGRINIGINRLKQLFPDKQIVLLTPLHRSLADLGEKNVQPDENYQNRCVEYVAAYEQAVKEAGNVWGVPVIDFNAVTAAIDAVVRDKDYTEQLAVDAMAKAIEDAIKALQLKPTPETTTTIPETTTTEQVTTNQETTTVEQVPTTSRTEATTTMVNPTETETQYITTSVNDKTPKTGENSNIT